VCTRNKARGNKPRCSKCTFIERPVGLVIAGIDAAGTQSLIGCSDIAGVHACRACTGIAGPCRVGAPPVTGCIGIAGVHSCIADMIGLGAVSAR